MALMDVFQIAGSGMSAQTVRLNTTASNLSNAETPSSTSEGTYRARYPVFATIMHEASGALSKQTAGVTVNDIVESQKPVRKQYQPGHPQANKEGFVFLPNVNVVEEMSNMISASRSYQMNTQVLSSAKQMMHKTLQLGQ